MYESDVTVTNKLGLHARASAKLTKLAASFPCDISICKGERCVNAKSIMGVMMLAAGVNSTLQIKAEGEKAQEAIEGLLALFSDKFGEGE